MIAKAPRAGASKTRLCPPLQPEQAASLARAFLLDSLTLVRQSGFVPRLVCRGPEEQRALTALVEPETRVSAQAGRGLGDALEGAFREGLADALPAVAVLGADSPTLPPEILHEAFAALAAGADVALGPCEGGGYYLMAATAFHVGLFRDMPWSTDLVAAEALRRCRALRLRTHLLLTWYDVDEAVSLDRLRADLRQGPANRAPWTRSELASLVGPPVAALTKGGRA